MKKFFSDNVVWFIIALFLAVAFAIYMTISNRKRIDSVNDSCAALVEEEKDTEETAESQA